LPDRLAARAPRRERVPAIAALAARGLAAEHRQALTTVDFAGEQLREPLGGQLTVETHAEVDVDATRRALQSQRERAVGREQLEAAVDARHRAHGDEPPACTLRHPREQ